MPIGAVDWSEAERMAWRPPEKLTPSQWAEQYRILSRRQSSRPGPWRNATSPCLVGIMDLCVDPRVRKLNIKKAGQMGASEALRNVLGRMAHLDPDPVLLILPDEKTGRKIMRKRIIPLIEDTPVLAELQTSQKRDKKVTEITLKNGFSLSLGWAGSAASLAADNARVVIADEVDKFRAFTGQEADPVSLGEVRTATYPNSLEVNISTPTTSQGMIHRLHDASPIKLWFHAPCPRCGLFQQLSYDRLRWEHFDQPSASLRASEIKARKAAWYECAGCNEKLLDDSRPKMLSSGYWGTADGGYKRFPDHEEGDWPLGDEVGVHLSTLHSLAARHSLPSIAANFVACDSKPDKIQNHRNSWRGETFEQQLISTPTNLYKGKCIGAAPERLIPKWVSRLLMTVDTQKDHFWFVVRGWGHGFRSQRIHHGRVQTFEELTQIAFNSYWPYEGDAFPAQCCTRMAIDSGGGKAGTDGSRTDEVYRFGQTDQARIVVLKGESESRGGLTVRLRRVTYRPPQANRSPYEVMLHLIDTSHFQDVLAARIGAEIETFHGLTGELTGKVEQWALNRVDDPEYNRQLASMHKVLDPRTRKQVWKLITSGAANHYRDLEVYQQALAAIAGCDLLPPPEILEEQRRLARQNNQQPRGGMTTPDGRPFLITQR